jgi:hypothetical protein
VIGAVPLLESWMLRAHGLPAAYLTLAAMSGVSGIANLFVMDRPPATTATVGDPHDE